MSANDFRHTPAYLNNAALHEHLFRIEAKLDTLIAALAEEEDEQPEQTLDGSRVPGDRDQTRGL